MSQAEVSQLSGYVWVGPAADEATVSQLSIYLWLEPGSDEGDPPEQQGFCYAQKVRRD